MGELQAGHPDICTKAGKYGVKGAIGIKKFSLAAAFNLKIGIGPARRVRIVWKGPNVVGVRYAEWLLKNKYRQIH